MRIHFTSLSRPKRVAKSLRRELSANGIDTTLTACQNLAAEMFGYAHWHELESHVGREAASPDDEAVTAEEAAERRAYQVGAVARRHPTLAFRAATIVDAVKPTRTTIAAPSGDRRRVTTLERPDQSGAAITGAKGEKLLYVGATFGEHQTVVMLAKHGGAIKLYATGATVSCAEDVWDAIDGGLARKLGGHELTDCLALFGLLPGAEPPERTSADDLAAARRSIERHIDRDALDAASTQYNGAMKVYDFLRSHKQPQIAEFVSAYPGFVHELAKLDDVPTTSTVRQTMAEIVRRTTGIGIDASKVADALAGMGDWARRLPSSHLPPVLSVISDLPAERVPTSEDEVDGFVSACTMTRLFGDYPRETHIGSLARLVLSVEAPTWCAVRDVMRSTGDAAVDRLKRAGHSLRPTLMNLILSPSGAGGDANLEMARDAFFNPFDDILKAFVSDVVLPLAARTDGEALAIHGLDEDDRPLPLHHTCEGRCRAKTAALLAEGLTFADAVEMSERWFENRNAAKWRRPPPADPADMEELARRLDAWRPFLRPRYRGITLEQLAAMAAEPAREYA